MINRVQARQSAVRTTTAMYSPIYDNAAYLESSLEVDYFILQQFGPRLDYFEMQPNSIEYLAANGKLYRYTPDAALIVDGHYFVDEVKYLETANKPENLEKHARLREFFELDSKEFRVITEADIRVGSRATNLRLLYRTLFNKPNLDALTTFLNQLPYASAPLSQLLVDAKSAGFPVEHIYIAVGHGYLKGDLTQPMESVTLSWARTLCQKGSVVCSL